MFEVQKHINYYFKDEHLLKTALTHKSYKQSYDNERLEFLGDAVLDLIIGEYLYLKFEDTAEGDLSKMRSSLVNEKSFEKFALFIHLGESIFLSIAEENNGGRKKSSILSNAFEAVIGAIYLEAGIEETKKVVITLLESVYPKISLDILFKDHKTTLQEITQARFGVTPSYNLLRSFGPDHKKEFEIEVVIKQQKIAIAKGKSKKQAQQSAAKKALDILNKEEHE